MATTYINDALVPIGHSTVTIDNTAGGVALTAANLVTHQEGGFHRRPVEALITNETAEIRWTVDGTAPTTTVGHALAAGDSLIIQGVAALQNFRAIRTGGVSGVIHVTYFARE